tara:strand:+ start:1157 stop:1633 length:477 start_codon:yes stop_codon:yes gene_type:complete
LNQSITFSVNLKKLKIFAEKLAEKSKISDIILLQGEIGTGKTTFARFFINALYRNLKLPIPYNIKSPSFPIMISYDLKKYEVYHYDLFRLKKSEEINELNLFENIMYNITIIEWPNILMKKLKKINYYCIQFSFIDCDTRKLKLNHSSNIIKYFKSWK